MEKVSVLLISSSFPGERFFESLETNRDFIEEVILPLPAKNVEVDLPLRFVGEELPAAKITKADLRNFLVSKASSDKVLFVSESTYLDEDFVEELLEEREQTSADVVFANPIYVAGEEERLENLEQPYGREKTLISSLAIENFVPEWGVFTTKEVLEKGKGFDPFLEDYEFYDFLYRNLDWLSLRLSELTYFSQEVKESYVDTSWRSYVLRRMLGKYDWKTEVFPYLSWNEREDVAKATALTLIGNQLFKYFDLMNASNCYREALLSFHNQETLRRLIASLKGMGFFEKVRELLSPSQGLSEEEIERELEVVSGIEKVIKELETAVQEGKVLEALAAATELAKVYEGAPLYNLFGVINWIKKDLENAYRFFHKAVTMNPLDRDFLFNLSSVAKELDREEKVEKLLKILLSEAPVEGRV